MLYLSMFSSIVSEFFYIVLNFGGNLFCKYKSLMLLLIL